MTMRFFPDGQYRNPAITPWWVPPVRRFTAPNLWRYATVLPSAFFCQIASADSFLHPQGPIAAEQRLHFWFVIIVMAAVVIPIFVIMPFLLWRYRYGQTKSAYRPRWSQSRIWEALMWGGPLVILVVLSIALWRETFRLDPYQASSTTVVNAADFGKPASAMVHLLQGPPAPGTNAPKPVRVEVIGLDWKWLFIYPDAGIASINALVVPVGTPIEFQMTSDTVMMSFFIPALGSQIYAMNHMATQLWLSADRPGVYEGENTQYSGSGFYQQRFTVSATSNADFDAWIKEQQRAGRVLTSADVATLRKESTVAALSDAFHVKNGTPITFKSVPSSLFDDIVHYTPIDKMSLIEKPAQ